MKVLMLGRLGLHKFGGGDKVQIQNTSVELKKLGVEIDYKEGLNFNPKNYDLVHAFQLDWTPETFLYAKKTKDCGVPLVLSPIHHSLEEVKAFDDYYVFDFRRASKVLFKNQFHRDTFKNVYKSIFEPVKIPSTIYSVFYGFERMLKNTLKMSDVVLVQTNQEAKDLRDTFKIDFKWVKIPNGVSTHFNTSTNFPNELPFQDYIICVGRIEPRKNQLNVIKAVKKFRDVNKIDVNLLFIGSIPNSKHFEYLHLFNKEIAENSWIKFIERVPYEKMPAYYKYAKVCVSASWFETTGLTSLEALFCGTNAVASGSRAKECLGASASYCSPGDVDSITAAIEKEYYSERPIINEEMKNEFTWENAARLTVKVYEELVKKDK